MPRLGYIRGAVVLTCVFGMGRASTAQDSWQRPSRDWTETDARAVLNHSPWAREVLARCGSQNKAVRAHVRFEESKPVREALLKLGVLPGSDQNDREIAVAILLSHAAGTQCKLTSLEAAASKASLLFPGSRESARLIGTKTMKQDETEDLVVFRFVRPATLPVPQVFRLPWVVLHSTELVFRARIGDIELLQSFPLKDMYYLGRLEL